MKEYAYFRVDASSEIGLGHLARCLSIAQYLSQLNIHSHFVCKNHEADAYELIVNQGYELTLLPIDQHFNGQTIYQKWLASSEDWDAEHTLQAIKHKARIVIVDHYGLSNIWQRRVSEKCQQLIVIDDLANRHHQCDLLIDSGLNRSELDYKGLINSKCHLLLGSNYTLLKQDYYRLIEQAKRKREQTTEIKNVLIAFGGTDPYALSMEALEAIQTINMNFKIDVVISSLCPWLDDKQQEILSKHNTRLHVDCQNVHELILNADFAIGSFGVSAIERCTLGLPSLNCKVADNQTHQATQMTMKSLCFFCDKGDLTDAISKRLSPSSAENSIELSQISDACFRNYGANGMEAFIKHLDLAPQHPSTDQPVLQCIPLNSHHLDTLYYWQTLPDTRRYFNVTEVPEYKQHLRWFEHVINNQDVRLWVLALANILCGYVRLDTQDNSEEVSIFVTEEFRNQGVAYNALDWAKEASIKDKVIATVHQENTASVNLFVKSGFKPIGRNQFIWEKSDEAYTS